MVFGEDNPYRFTTYPAGPNGIPMLSEVMVGFISAASPNAEACYRFLRAASRDPQILMAMPADLSVVSDPAFRAAAGAEASTYEQMAAQGMGGAFEEFPSFYNRENAYNGYINVQWMLKAFDDYVLEDVALGDALRTAQDHITEYEACALAVDVPEDLFDDPEANQERITALYRDFAECAIAVDPTTREQFSYLFQDDE